MSLSFNKFIEKVGENINRPSHQDIIQNVDSGTVGKFPRPGSPFILLLSEGDEEFNFIPNNLADEQDERDEKDVSGVFDQDSVGSSFQNGSQSNLSVDENESVGLYNSKVTSGSNSIEDNTSDQDYTSDGTYDMSTTADTFEEQIALKEDERRSFRDKPMTKEQFEKLFDECGRLVNEHDLRKAIFKGGVDENIRKDVWQFLFELYPLNTTAREREILMIEQKLRYEAMKIRWKILLRSLVSEYEGVWYCPKWYSACPKNAKEHTEQIPRKQASISVSSVEESSIVVDNLTAKTFERKLIIPTEKELQASNLSHSDFELQSSDLICHENPEEQLVDLNSDCEQSRCVTKAVQSNLLSHATDGIQFDRNTVSNSMNVDDNGYGRNEDENFSSLNFECDEVDSISEALADAMLDVGNQTNRSCDRDDVILQECEAFHILHSESIKTESIFKPIDTVENSETDLDEIRFPNPFTFPGDYINNQESLYSKSENFKSLDIMKFDVSVTVKTKDEASISCPDENADTICNSHQLSEGKVDDDLNGKCNTENMLNKESDSIKSVSNLKSDGHDFEEQSDKNTACSVDNCIAREASDSEIDSSVFHFELSDKDANETPILKIDQSSSNTNESINNNQADDLEKCQPKEEDLEVQKVNSTNSKHSMELNLNLHERRESLARSPTGEMLENIPPWIAQIIKASTPGSASKPVDHQLVSINRDSIDGLISPVRNDSYDPEILDIVENANRFLREQQLKCGSGYSTPTKNFPRVQRYEEDREVTRKLTKTVSAPTEIFTSSTPKIKFMVSFDTVECEKITSQDKLILTGCPYCNFDEKVTQEVALPISSLGEEQLKFMKLQAQVFAARQPYNEKLISSSVRVIDKDVPRTDRELALFSGDDNPGLIKLRDALLTYAFFHPDVGYAQGMNDIMSRFLVVMDTEAEAYWMFVNYMEVFKDDFMEEGMLRKIALVEQLLMKMDRGLHDYLQAMDMGLMFCHRWLLLNFKREFDYMEAIRLFEITSSRHLEVYSFAAELERSKERAKEFKKDSTGSHLEEIYLSAEYPYDIFVCVTMLMECRQLIMDTTDLTAVYEILSNLPTTLDLQNILRKSEELFYRFCRKTVGDCFQVIDELEVQDFDEKKKHFSFNFR